MTNQDLETMKPSYAEQKRLDMIESLHYIIADQDALYTRLRKKFFRRKKTRTILFAKQEELVGALALAINILEKVSFKDGVYPFEIANKILGLNEDQIELILGGADAAQKELSLYHDHGIWKDNYRQFTIDKEISRAETIELSLKNLREKISEILAEKAKVGEQGDLGVLQVADADPSLFLEQLRNSISPPLEKAVKVDDVAAKTSTFWPNE